LYAQARAQKHKTSTRRGSDWGNRASCVYARFVILGTLAAISLVRLKSFAAGCCLGNVQCDAVCRKIITGITQLLLFISMLNHSAGRIAASPP